MPSRTGTKSLSHSAWRACTAVGSISSADSASAKRIVLSMRDADSEDDGPDEGDQRERAGRPSGGIEHLAQVGAEEHEQGEGRDAIARR